MNDFLYLDAGDLRASVLLPECPDYCRTRFAHTGLVAALSYKGASFAEPEQRFSPRETSGGIGLSAQYIFPQSEAEAALGEPFLRLGIGEMTKRETSTGIMRDAPYASLHTAVTREGAAAVRFETRSPEVGGYAYKETRLVRAEGDTLTVETAFTNIGAKPIHAFEYNHNFVSINALPVDERYTMLLPCLGDIENELAAPSEGRPVNMLAAPGGLTWDKHPQTPFFKIFERVTPAITEYAWKLVHRDSAATIREVDDFVPARVVVWGVEHCACAEVYMRLDAAPGQTVKWTRKWVLTA